MLYFGISGDEHVFNVPFDYLRKVILHFYYNEFGDDYLFNDQCVHVFYSCCSDKCTIDKIQMLLLPNCNNFASLITIDVNDLDDGNVVWYSNFYRFFLDCDQSIVLRFHASSEFYLSDFENEYFEDLSCYRYDDLFISEKYIKLALDRPLPF